MLPQSGWTHAAGERGPGLALWRALATVAARRTTDASFTFLAPSGHELAHAGLGALIAEIGPMLRDRLALWIHLGANLATFDYARGVVPLTLKTTVNGERGVGASADVLDRVRAAFAGMPDLPVADLSSARAFGEAKQIVAAGFAPVVGLVGSGVFHHVALDRAPRSTSGELVRPLATALAGLIGR